jgi:hypothetical protein
MFADFEDNTENDHDKLCCFVNKLFFKSSISLFVYFKEVNGHNLLNGSKRHRYD